MAEPWIKLYRKFTEWEWYQDTNCKVVFLHLLLTANWEKKRWQGMEVDAGELVTSNASLAEEVCLTVDQVRLALKKLVECGAITRKSTNRFTIITIRNFKTYQTNPKHQSKTAQRGDGFEEYGEPNQSPNKSQTEPNQNPTPKELKNGRNIEYKDYSSGSSIYNINNIYSDSAASSAEVQSVFKAYQENIGVLSPRTVEILSERIAAQGAALVSLAVVEAAECNARNVRYIEKVLIAWEDAGVKSVEDVKLRQAERAQKKASAVSGNVAKSKFRNYPEKYEITEDDKKFIEKAMWEYEADS